MVCFSVNSIHFWSHILGRNCSDREKQSHKCSFCSVCQHTFICFHTFCSSMSFWLFSQILCYVKGLFLTGTVYFWEFSSYNEMLTSKLLVSLRPLNSKWLQDFLMTYMVLLKQTPIGIFHVNQSHPSSWNNYFTTCEAAALNLCAFVIPKIVNVCLVSIPLLLLLHLLISPKSPSAACMQYLFIEKKAVCTSC